MVYKSGKMKGQLTTTEIRKLIRAHNVLMSIKIPPKSSREDIMKILQSNNYKVDHEAEALVPLTDMKRKPKVNMKKASDVLPKPKTKEEKKASKAERDKKKSMKEKDLKQQGFKAGASLQRAVSKRQARKKTVPKKEKKPATLQLGDKPADKPAPFKKALRAKLNKEFKQKFKTNIWNVLEFSGATATPSPAEVKKRCRKLKLKHHPDKTGGDDEMFKKVQEACDVYVESFKPGQDIATGYDIPASMTQEQKNEINEYIDEYSDSMIKNYKTREELEEKYDKAQDLYYSIQKRFLDQSRGMRMTSMSEVREWFSDNMSMDKFREYEETEKKMKRRMNAQVRRVDKAKKDSGGFSIAQIKTVFKDIMTGYKEIVDEADPDAMDASEKKDNKKRKTLIKTIQKNISEDKPLSSKPQKEVIKMAVEAYLDGLGADDGSLKDEIAIAKLFLKFSNGQLKFNFKKGFFK